MSKFVYKSKASKEAAKKATERGSGSFNRYKMQKSKVRLLVLASTSEDVPCVFQTVIHEMWSNGRPTDRVASPSFDGDQDELMQIGFKLKNKYEKSKNKKHKDFWLKFMPKRNNSAVVLDLDDIDAGPQLYQMPSSVAKTIFDEINDQDGDLTSITHFDEGRILQVKHNGKSGLAKEYTSKFLPQTANLIADGILDEEQLEEMANKMPSLVKLQPRLDENALEAYKEKLLKQAEKLGIEIDGEETEEDDDDLEEAEEVDDDELELDDDDDSEEEESEEEEEAEEEESEEEEEVEEEESEEDDSEDEDDFEFDEDEDEEEEEVVKKPAQKVKQKVEDKKATNKKPVANKTTTGKTATKTVTKAVSSGKTGTSVRRRSR